jgi:hypothetical protein
MGGETLQRPATEQQASGRYHWTVDSFYFGNFIAKAGSGGFGGYNGPINSDKKMGYPKKSDSHHEKAT